MFKYLISPRDITKYTLMRGVTDFGNLNQYNLYETGYPFFAVVSKPKMLENLADSDTDMKTLLDNYIHILEYEFRGLDGIEDISAETQTLTNGISDLNIITKVTQQSASSFSMRFFEKSGSVITRMHELFLRGIKDPRTQVKHYNGRLGVVGGIADAGYENEIFTFLYFVTDNTCRKIEKSYLIIAAQPSKAETSIYNAEKGEISFKEISVEFNGFPITGDEVDKRAVDLLNWMNNLSNANHMILDSNNFMYTGISDIGKAQLVPNAVGSGQ